MRLSPEEQQAFISVLSNYIRGSAELRVFGSRTNDKAKGGDIDLLLLLDDPSAAEEVMYYRAKILSEIKAIIGEQKIDLLIANKPVQDVFLESVYPKSLLIHKFS